MFNQGQSAPGRGITQENQSVDIEILSTDQVNHIKASAKELRREIDRLLPRTFEASTECVNNNGKLQINVFVLFNHQVVTNMQLQVTEISTENDPAKEFEGLNKQIAAATALEIMLNDNQQGGAVAK